MPILKSLARFVNTFRVNDARQMSPAYSMGPSTSVRPHTPRLRYTNERSIIASIYTRIGIDVAGVDIRHIKLDEKNRYRENIKSELNRCFTLEPNIDQGPFAFRLDIAMTMFDGGTSAIVPVDTSVDPNTGEILEIHSIRVGEIIEWLPKHVRVSLYNEDKGIREDVLVPKRETAIIENPFYSVMNESNSTLKRLTRKLSLLDVVDEQSSSGKLDIIIQLPYVVKTEAMRQRAEKRREDIEFQLKGSQYGIAYADGTEKITQLNRPAENNLLAQVEYLTKMLYDEIGITEKVMDGTADEATMLNYHNRTIDPILTAITQAMHRTFVGAKGVDNGEQIRAFRNPFKYMPMSQIAEVTDKLARNEVVTSNEMRDVIGLPPSDDPKADMLVNSNMPQPGSAGVAMDASIAEMDSIMNETLDGLSSDVDEVIKGLADG